MKHIIFRSIAIAATLLVTAVNASAQYHYDGDVGTSKTVTGPDTLGNYTIRLETFATGSTTVTESYVPADIALVLDLSTSMRDGRGTTTPVTSKALTYNDVVNARSAATNYLFNGYQLFGEVNNGRYYLYYNGSGSNDRNYICIDNRGRTRVTTRRQDALSADSPDGTIVTFPGANGSYALATGSSRIFALKEAVCAFIDTINEKDKKEDGTRIGHKLSIITFESDVNVTQSLASLSSLDLNALQAKVWAFSLRTGTQPSEGIDEANTQFSNSGRTGTVGTDYARTVVVFTDGEPYDNPKYKGVSSANTSKNTYSANVYTVGMFNSTPNESSDTWKFMNAMSSNYPNATQGGGGTADTITLGSGSDKGFYKDASSANVDLSAIFKAIAESAGGAAATIGTSTQVRDVVTNSFILPSTVEAADVHVYTSAATGSATGADDTNPAGWANPVALTTVTVTIENVDADGNPTQNASQVKNKALFVTGFDYSKDDTTEGEGDGNWVGVRYKNGNYFWAGKKLIITFKVKADGEATGGETLTNTGKSGVYLKNDDGTYTAINYYEQPHKTLTVNIKIRKTGLRSGESATFELMRIRPKGYDETATTLAGKIAGIEYNLIGKPIPDTHAYSGSATQPDMSDYYEGMGWEGFKKVILTNKGENGAEVVKEIYALDPYWVYLVLEDDWGWAYTMTGDTNQVGDDGTYTTSSVEVNPFRFHNTEEAGAVKHAEAIMINHFKSNLSGAKVEHYKSSKVESFTSSK